jgi:23S rRNA (guanine745-N1)-methyltransferase
LNAWSDAWPLACPVCDGALRVDGRVLSCEAGHSYDVAREGYVNLLVPQHRERGIEGDTREMLRARRRFLEAGHYRRLRERLIEEAASTAPAQPGPGRFCVAEMGSGEGYYVGGVAEALTGRGEGTFVGVDVSRDAARLAAKRYGGVRFVVGNVRRKVPLETGSVDVLLNVFAPRNPAEYGRVTRTGGRLVVVIPGPDHLAEAREALGLIGVQEAKEERVAESLSPWFEPSGRVALEVALKLAAAATSDLVSMGPSRWHREEEEEEEAGEESGDLAPSAGPEVTASFVVLGFTRSG